MTRTLAPDSLDPAGALDRLLAGNARFASHRSEHTGKRFDESHAYGQLPFAVVLGCADSRTPVELVFDQGLGDLFVLRVAGHVVAPSIVGSVEFAISKFGTRLVVVMGHTRCGAIEATVDEVLSGDRATSRNVRAITDRIRPHVAELVRARQAAGEQGVEGLQREAERANVRASVDHLRHGSRMLEELLVAGRIGIVGMEYELETGTVHVLDDLGERL